ncbi:hypothetical protein AHF37_06570 [Paragonimus kellicotti]|nr:hypothetical protein AHF37_06570 [Paragonimus kellicotti]
MLVNIFVSGAMIVIVGSLKRIYKPGSSIMLLMIKCCRSMIFGFFVDMLAT